MKRMLFIAMLIVLSSIIYGQESRIFTTSEGDYWSCQIQYIGKNKGQENANFFGGSYSRIERLSNTQLDYVREMLNSYQRGSGDTFYLTISFWPLYWNRNHPYSSAMVFVEYDSNTDWGYWAFNILNRR